MELSQGHRHRVNFSVTSKGVVSCDVTFECEGFDRDSVVKEAGLLLELAQAVCDKKNGGLK